tara:strand:+ start:196 stop:360 length:165 start_codon:yes stop_codon:yes gene_type:complete
MKWINGYKSYIVAIIAAVLAGLKAYGVDVPPEVFALVGALGLGAVSHKINRAAK